MTTPDPPLDLDALRFEPLSDRPSKVRLSDLGRPAVPARARWKSCWRASPRSWRRNR